MVEVVGAAIVVGEIQVSYLRKTLGSAEPGGSTVVETRAGGCALLVEPEQIDAHRFEAASRRFTSLHAVRSETELHRALDEVERALALWRGDALEDVADMEFARGETAGLEELRWLATERRLDLCRELARRLEHEATEGTVLRKQGHDRQREGGGFTGTGLRGAD